MDILTPLSKILNAVEYKRFVSCYVFDSKTFPKNSVKIEDLGVIRKKKFAIMNNKEGELIIEEIITKVSVKEIEQMTQLLIEIKHLKDEEIITTKEFKKLKSKILKNI